MVTRSCHLRDALINSSLLSQRYALAVHKSASREDKQDSTALQQRYLVSSAGDAAVRPEAQTLNRATL